MGVTRKRSAALRASQQLQSCLAVAVLEILARETVTVDAQQAIAARACHQSNRFFALRYAEPTCLADSRGGREGVYEPLSSGRHASMSAQVAPRPPSQLARQWLSALDRYQQRKRRLGFAVAVVKRFDDDQASQMGALIAYYGFFSLFPLLLVFVTVLGFVLEGNPGTQESVLHSTLSQFPIIGTQLQANVHSLKGNVISLAIGLVGALFAGLGVTGATQSAFNNVWRIPRRKQPGFLAWRLRGVGLFAILGVLSVISTVSAGFVTAQTAGPGAVIAGVVIALAANLVLFFTVFRILTAEEISTHDLLPGVIFAAVMWQILQHVGGFYVDHVVRHAKETSGLFAFVLGLLSWLYLGGQVTVLAAELNVVRAQRLWPRSLLGDEPSPIALLSNDPKPVR
jgi:YihY family inner membrane protein